MTVTVSTLLDVVEPERYYSAVDAGDWLPAFLRAQAIGRTIRLRPAKTYTLSGSVRNVSNRIWQGSGPSTVVQVDSGAPDITRGAFMFGDMHPAAFKYSSPSANQFPSYNLNAVIAGATKVTCTTAGDASNFTVGQFVWVRHRTEVVAGGINYPLYAQLTKVYALPGSGVVELADPILEPIASACISPIGSTTDAAMGYPFEVVEGVTIQDMTVDARAITSTRTGAYHCAIRDVGVVNASFLLSINAFVKCTSERISGVTTDRLLEIKCYSQDNDWRQITGRISGTGSNTPCDIGEQSNRQRLAGVRLTLPPEHTAAVPALTLNGWLNAVRDSEFIHAGTVSGQAVVTIPSNNFTGYGPNRNRIEGGRIVATSDRTHYVIVGSSAATADPIGYVIDGVEFVGVTSSAKSIKVANGGVSGRVENCALPYVLEISSGATAPSESGNSLTAITGGSVSAGTATPVGAISGEAGSLYQRRGDTSTYPLHIKTGSTANNGWLRVLALAGVSSRTDNDFTAATTSGLVQLWNVTLNADRTFSLPAVSAADNGWPFIAIKNTTAGTGKLLVNDDTGTKIAEVAAAAKGIVWCWWTGTAWVAFVTALV